MSKVVDAVGREFNFDRIRFSFDEDLLQQAGTEVVAQDRDRAQLVFDRYCVLHLAKYRRNFEPSHFASGKLLGRFRELYQNPAPAIFVTIEVTSGALFERFVGQPFEFVEQSVRLDPGAWVRAGVVRVEQG